MAAARNGSPYGEGALHVRVGALEKNLAEFHIELRDVRSSMATREDIRAIAGQLTSLASEQDASARPNWQMWGVFATAIIALGTLAYLPIKGDTARMDASIQMITERAVFQRQYEADGHRTAAELANLNEQLQAVRRGFMRQDDFNAQHGDLKAFIGTQVENLQRQITGLQQRLNDTWGARDALVDLRQRLERVERAGH